MEKRPAQSSLAVKLEYANFLTLDDFGYACVVSLSVIRLVMGNIGISPSETLFIPRATQEVRASPILQRFRLLPF